MFWYKMITMKYRMRRCTYLERCFIRCCLVFVMCWILLLLFQEWAHVDKKRLHVHVKQVARVPVTIDNMAKELRFSHSTINKIVQSRSRKRSAGTWKHRNYLSNWSQIHQQSLGEWCCYHFPFLQKAFTNVA